MSGPALRVQSPPHRSRPSFCLQGSRNVRLLHFQGQPVVSLAQLAAAVAAATQSDPFLRFDVDHDEVVILESAAVGRSTQQVMKAHAIPSAMSADLEQSTTAAGAAGPAPKVEAFSGMPQRGVGQPTPGYCRTLPLLGSQSHLQTRNPKLLQIKNHSAFLKVVAPLPMHSSPLAWRSVHCLTPRSHPLCLQPTSASLSRLRWHFLSMSISRPHIVFISDTPTRGSDKCAMMVSVQ